MISFMVAIDENGGIGKDGTLPWKLPSDMRWFRETTTGHTVIMGRRTYEAIGPGGLKNRENVVLSRTLPAELPGDIHVWRGFPSLLSEILDSDDEIFVIGGAQIFDLFYPYADRLYVTVVHETFDCDTFFDFERDDWSAVNQWDGVVDSQNPYSHTFYVLERRREDK